MEKLLSVSRTFFNHRRRWYYLYWITLGKRRYAKSIMSESEVRWNDDLIHSRPARQKPHADDLVLWNGQRISYNYNPDLQWKKLELETQARRKANVEEMFRMFGKSLNDADRQEQEHQAWVEERKRQETEQIEPTPEPTPATKNFKCSVCDHPLPSIQAVTSSKQHGYCKHCKSVNKK